MAPALVSAIHRDDGRGNRTTTQFQYGCPAWSQSERALLGWERVEAHHPAAPNRPGYWTKTTYLLKPGLAEPTSVTRLTEDGRTRLAYQTYGYGDTVYRRTPPYDPLVSSESSVRCDATCSTRSLTRTTAYRYDEFGNVTSKAEGYDTAAWVTYSVFTSTDYVPLALQGRYLAALPTRTRVVSSSGAITAETRYCYDNAVTCPGQPTTGLLTSVSSLNRPITSAGSGDTRPWVTTHYAYWPDGDLKATTDPDGRTSTISYDPVQHTLLWTTCPDLRWQPASAQLRHVGRPV